MIEKRPVKFDPYNQRSGSRIGARVIRIEDTRAAARRRLRDSFTDTEAEPAVETSIYDYTQEHPDEAVGQPADNTLSATEPVGRRRRLTVRVASGALALGLAWYVVGGPRTLVHNIQGLFGADDPQEQPDPYAPYTIDLDGSAQPPVMPTDGEG